MLAAAAFLSAVPAAHSPAPAIAACDTIKLGGKQFVFYKRGPISCGKAMTVARQVYAANRAPKGWACPDASPGMNRRDGANCYRRSDPETIFGYHAFD